LLSAAKAANDRWRGRREPGEICSAAMNYQHAFHAGNFADVHKHIVLARILTYLRAKPAAFRVIDTHAGAGRYDLLAAESSRSGEWHSGIERVWEAAKDKLPPRVRELLVPYLDAVAACNSDGVLRTYPGSPLIAEHLMRAQDRLIACELEPRSAAALTAALRGDRRAKALAIDGWTALGAYVPPKERRGVVLTDPPFEDAGDFMRLSGALAAAHRKWPTGIYMLWYPIKGREAPDGLARRLERLAIPRVLRSEIMLGRPRNDAGLVGSGLIVVNPPFTLEAELRALLPPLGRMLAPQVTYGVDWLTPNS
jgi:23S rRNA (adenine2030-N6)-methyltransferase